MVGDYKENVIEWITGEKEISCTFTQQRFITRARKLAEKNPDIVKIIADNSDGSLYVKMPLRALHLTIYDGSSRAGINPFVEEEIELRDDE